MSSSFVSQRWLPLSPQQLFSALRDPDRLARWWGPTGFSNRFERFEFEPGGRWVFDMVGPDGVVYPNRCVFERIEADHAVVIRHDCAPMFTLTIDLQAQVQDGRKGCHVHWTQVFDDPRFAQAMAHILTPANEQNLDRWAAEVARPLA